MLNQRLYEPVPARMGLGGLDRLQESNVRAERGDQGGSGVRVDEETEYRVELVCFDQMPESEENGGVRGSAGGERGGGDAKVGKFAGDGAGFV
jgi:hypothetical protein